MKALILGAGASKAAGYPLAGEIRQAIEDWASRDPDRTAADNWDYWNRFRRRIPEPMCRILDNPNLEVVLSAIDLYALTFDEEFHWLTGQLDENGQICDDAHEVFNRYTSKGDPERFAEVRCARRAFLRCLDGLFGDLHSSGRCPENRVRRDYLRQLLRGLDPGDVVITLNWDTTVERTLAEEHRWNPTDGYGFRKQLAVQGRGLEECLRPCGDRAPSEIQVLKLHGSYGWFYTRQNEICFERSRFLAGFPFCDQDSGARIVDPTEEGPSAPVDYAFLYPTFLKRPRGSHFQQIWRKAAAALSSSSSIDIWGYSLPESDVAVRVLLSVLRTRLETSKDGARVCAHDPCLSVQQRLRDFLGDRASVDGRSLGA